MSINGACVVTEDGVSLKARTFAYAYSTYAPYTWVYRSRSVDETTWRDATDLGFRSWANVISGGNFTGGFKSLPVPTDGMAYRLDLIYGSGNNRVNCVAFYDDSTTTRRDYRHPA